MYDNRSFEEKLHAAKAMWKVEELKGRHAYLHATGNSREEYDVIWHRCGHTTFGHGFGRMCGFYQDFRYDMLSNEDKEFITGNWNIINKFPEFEGHDLRSTGCTGLHALASSVIEVSQDGKSARSYYLTPGILMGSVGMDCKHRGGNWLWERYGSDFIFFEGEWKWFHEQVCPDVGGVYDYGNWAYDNFSQYMANDREPMPHGFPPMDEDMEFGSYGFPPRLAEPATLHNQYSCTQTIQKTVEYPVPYFTLNNANTYSPDRNNPYAVGNEREPE